jgi:4-carboxymuconolactone decarboxylase
MSAEQAAVHDFCRELHEKKHVSDANYARVVERFGEHGAVDLIGIIGYYTLVSMILNVDRVPIPGGAPAPLPPLA